MQTSGDSRRRCVRVWQESLCHAPVQGCGTLSPRSAPHLADRIPQRAEMRPEGEARQALDVRGVEHLWERQANHGSLLCCRRRFRFRKSSGTECASREIRQAEAGRRKWAAT